VTLRNYQPVEWVLYQRVIDQLNADILIKPGIMNVVVWGAITKNCCILHGLIGLILHPTFAS
jgi:hypothetical protein